MNGNEREQRFARIYSAHVDDVYRFVFVRTGLLTAVAEDITQEIFLEVFRGFDRFRGLCSEKTWVFRIARNKVTDFYRTKARRQLEIGGVEEEMALETCDPAQDVQMILEEACERDKVIACLQSLPEHYRMALLMKYTDGRSIKEIAEVSGRTAKAVENILARAKSAFIRQYTLPGGEDDKV